METCVLACLSKFPGVKYKTNVMRPWQNKVAQLPSRYLPSPPIGSLMRQGNCNMSRSEFNIRSLAVDIQAQGKTESDSFFADDQRPIMLFDGICNLCNGGVKFVRDNDPRRNIRFEALQSEAGRKLLVRSGRSPDDISSVVLVEKDRSYIKSEAVLRILTYLDLPYPQLAAILYLTPVFLRDIIYDNIANNRYAVFGKSKVF